MTGNLSTPASSEADLGRAAIQTVVQRYGWQPDPSAWPLAELLQVAQTQPLPLERAIERQVTCHYCHLWYNACRSIDPVQQRQALAALYPYIYRQAYRLTRKYCSPDHAQEVAADSAQVALQTVWEKLGQVKDPAAFLGWVQKVTFRAVPKPPTEEPPLSLDDETAPEIPEQPQPTEPDEAETEQTAKRRQIEDALRRCLRSKAQQNVIIEHFLNKRGIKGVADLLGESPGNIRVLKQRALTKLRGCEEMQKYMADHQKSTAGQTAKTQDNIAQLVRAIRGEGDKGLDHETVEAWLPSYVTSEVAGEDVATKYPDIHQHLALCAECETLYVELLELAMAEAADTFPQSGAAPKPDLSFLPPFTFVMLARRLVNEVTAQVLQTLVPTALTNLPALGELFFQRLEAMGGLAPVHRAPATTLGLSTDANTAALTTLTATYLTTQRIAATFSPATLQAQIDTGMLAATVAQVAMQVAQELGLTQAETEIFAQIYTQQTQDATATWLALVERQR